MEFEKPNYKITDYVESNLVERCIETIEKDDSDLVHFNYCRDNFETNEKSQLVFVQDEDTLQINTCIRIDLSNLNDQSISIFKNNYNV